MSIDDKQLAEWRRILDCYNLDPSVCSLIFRASACEAMPALLDEVERLRKALQSIADWDHGFSTCEGNCCCPEFAEETLSS